MRRHFDGRSDQPKIFGEDMAIGQFDDIYITGHFTSTIKFDQVSVSATPGANSYWLSTDVYLLKLTPEGLVSWARSGGGPEDLATSIAIDPVVNAVYLSASIEPGSTFASGKVRFGHIVFDQSTTHEVPVVARYDYVGTPQWVMPIAGV